MAKNIFNSVKMASVGSNRFNLSHDVKLSFKMGLLVPTCAMETLPGDKFTIGTETMLRFAPLVAPVMHKVNVTTHYFFVPNRLLWSNWDKWITGDYEGEHPYMVLTNQGITEKSIMDYLGYPVLNQIMSPTEGPLKINPMPIGAYYKIYDEYYRDQNLSNEAFVPLTDGDNSINYNYAAGDSPNFRAWMHDYFTSALPWAQKGDSVQIPLGEVDIEYDGENGGTVFRNPTTGDTLNNLSDARYTDSGGQPRDTSTTGTRYNIDNSANLVGEVQATDINSLRRAFRLQEWLEKNARGGTRYIESILVHWGVKSSDSRLQRPEYLGGSKSQMVISEVLSTAQTTNDAQITPVGQMAGHGISVSGGKEFNYRCEEHGWIIGIINVQPTTAYQQGLHKSFLRMDRLDYAWPSFANIGEQEVKISELYAETTGVDDTDLTFGYVPRYAEYKFMNSRVAGEMRSSLSFWHLGRIFENRPALNENFIVSQPSTRIFAVEDENSDHIYGHIFNNISVSRKLPVYGTPQF